MSQARRGTSPRAHRRAVKTAWERIKEHPLARVGPGLITGVADDDPSGIATYSQAGAQFGFAMLWTMPLTFPLMAAVQSMCARIGRVTGKGLAANVKAAMPPVVLQGVVFLLLIANTLNIAADVAAMGETAELVTGIDRHALTLAFVLVTVGLQVFVPYHRYVYFLKWLTLSLLSYVAVLFTVHVPWGEVLLRTILPKLTLDADAATVVVGVFGTTISPYLFFWQTSQEAEDIKVHEAELSLRRRPSQALAQFRRIAMGHLVMFHLIAIHDHGGVS
jgi:NRAMP (natural resistance-associated macrophage protein)-like metal ion transporter